MSTIPIYPYKKNYEYTSYQDLPPTPTSLSIVTDQKEDDRPQSVIDRSLYGTLLLASSSTASTISPDDDNESLYLLWTHQLLKERGYSTEDDESVDSSVTNISLPKRSWFSSCFPTCST